MQPAAKLQWRCRRGTLELDKMLLNYLRQNYAAAGAAEQQLFWQLLELQDDDLQAYLFGERRPTAQDLARLVDSIRRLPPA